MKVRLFEAMDMEKGFMDVYTIIHPVKDPKRIFLSMSVYVVEFKDKIIGTASFGEIYKPFGDKLGIIEDVAVHPDFRNIGVGKLLITEILKHAKRIEVGKIILTCKDEQVGFYRKCGFSKYQNAMVIKN